MFRKAFFIYFFHFSFLLSSTDEPLNQASQLNQFFISNTFGTREEKIELFFLNPVSQMSCPVVFLIHGSQSDIPGKGAKELIDMGYLEKFANEGILAVAISMPGYGGSEGVRDFAGPDSQKAMAAAINYVSQLPFVDSNRMGIYGISKGAILSSMVHLYYPNLKFQILEAGSYNLLTRSFQLPSYLEGILKAMKHEAGDSEEVLKERSAVFHTRNVTAETLLLHGEIDNRKGLSSARQLHELLLTEGKECTLKIFPKTPYQISEQKWDIIIPFLRKTLFESYGIGIKVTQTKPGIQVIDIYPESPAAKTGSIQIGDAILGISPNNDENEIEALNMPTSRFASFVLGKKGTTVRLRVQHLDNTYETIVIERG